MRIMKWTVPLLLGCLVLGSAGPTSAENVVVDSTVLETIQSHLVRALDGLNRMNLQRAWNHITRAMRLIPDPDQAPVGTFRIYTPFTWSASSGPMPIRVAAVIDDGTPQTLFQGTAILGMMGFGRLVTLYDANMVQLPGTQTTAFSYGGWQGYVMLDTGTGGSLDLGLVAHDPVSGAGGGSTAFLWTP